MIHLFHLLTRRPLLFAMLILLLATHAPYATAQGFDRVRHRNGIESGKITKMTALGVTITKGGVDRQWPVEEILSITFAGEPEDLAPARRFATTDRFESALKKLKAIDRTEVDRPEIQQEIDFLTLLSRARLALSGQGNLDQSRKEATKFLSSNSKSYHVPATIELLGDVLMASEDYQGARQQYAKLGKAPAPFYKARSAFLTGRSLQAEKKYQEAAEAFDTALKTAGGSKPQQLKATLHRAVCKAALGEAPESTKAVKQIITQTNIKNTQLLAEAYNALGDCNLLAGDKKSARHAFLHVDLLFSSAASQHAKALYELSQLWQEQGQPTRAQDAQQRLQKEYPRSHWAKR